MTLEDFFTLTEMRDGLSSLARVEELLSMIQKLNDCTTSNLGDAVRQWSTVAGVLAATDHKECLNQFLELNGLSLLNQWLQEALNLSVDVNGIVVEELICSLLTSFERLPIDHKRKSTSGIGITIELLLDHKSIPIKEKARILYAKWELVRNNDMSCHDQDQCRASESNHPRTCEDVKTNENCSNLVNSVVDVPPCLDISSLNSTENERLTTPNQVLSMSSNPINSNAEVAGVNSSGSSIISNSCPENLSITVESSVSVAVAVGNPSANTCSQSDQKGDTDDQHDVAVLKDVPEVVKGMELDMREGKSCKSNQRETYSNSSSLAFSASLTPLMAATEPMIACKMDSDNDASFASKTMEHQPKAGDFDHGREKSLITAKDSNPAVNLTSGFQDLSCTASIINNIGDPQLPCQREEALTGIVKDIDHVTKFKSRKGHFETSTDFFKVVGIKANKEISQKSELGLECLDDALEVARQVAIAVEREVVDYREPFCSSPEFNSGETTGSHSPESEEEKHDRAVTEEVDADSSSAGKDHSGTSSPEKESEITQNMSSDPEISEQDIESTKRQELVDKSIMIRCTFDLNADICSDKPECSIRPIQKIPINVTAPIAVVASSKGAPGLSVTPLHFGGEVGWKGSAATSAFRPASPRRTLEDERISSGSKQKSNFLQIDLNVTEMVDEVADIPASRRQVPASSSLPSGDSCVEVISRTEKKLNLDLNRLSDEDASMNPFSSWKLHFQHGEHSLSSASSSSYRQPSLRDFDLNDNPSLPDIGGSHNFDKSSTKASEYCVGPTPCDPVIKIMGSKIAAERKDNGNQVQHSFLPNGLNIEPTMVARPLLPCTNMPNLAYGYAGLPSAPTMTVPAAYYSPGSFSYMVDPRGATHLPHITGAGGLGGPSARPPFLLGATSVPSNMAGFGSSRAGFDLNGGMTSKEGGRFEQFFLQGHRGRTEDQTKTSAQPSSSGIALKRKEPDSGWEPSLYGFKHTMSRQ
ncbi:uncharacterized protein LOC103983218 isoform X1 [Musa acuminata AAA Group]|uniref:uncharacterized protein LOC103983218 isoform X1 n=1 Tax=Musa acuminata AAA Group TaxID=214697 RepID=UPI0031DE7F03